MKLSVPPRTVQVWEDGLLPPVEAGDLVLVRHHGFVARAIRFAQRLRKPRGVPRSEWRQFCRVNHACIALTSSPRILVAQATGAGVVVTPLHEMSVASLAVVHLAAWPDQAEAVVEFARDSVGTGYGFAQIAADLLNAASGLELSLGWGDRMVCSTAACRALERTSFIPDRAPDCVTPAHLAWYFGAIVASV